MGQEVTQKNAVSRELNKSASTTMAHGRRVYSKEFLLSVAELEDCTRVPAGLDSNLLRETECKLNDKGVAIPGALSRGLICIAIENDAHSESPPDVPEWRRPSSLPGSPFLKQVTRQADTNISSPRPGPARGGNTRSIMGRSGSARWEFRPGVTDRDRDMNHTRNEWESIPIEPAFVISQEHDGLLGSGGPIVHRGMIQTPAPDRHHAEWGTRTGRTGEQYHPARGGKTSRVSQHTRREDVDSVSDETFGSDDLPNRERSEQERQRRDSFEQMRKELRMKPLNTSRNYNDNWFGEGIQGTETFLSSSPGTPQSTSSSKDEILKPLNKAVVTSSTSRLLVPPGFSKPTIPKTGSPKENNEASKDQLEDNDQKTSTPSQAPMVSKFAHWFPRQGSSFMERESHIDKQGSVLSIPKSEGLPPLLGMLSGGSEVAVSSKLSSVASLMPITKKGSILPMPAGPSLEDVEKVITASAEFTGIVSSNEHMPSDRKSWVMSEDHVLTESGHAIMGDASLLMEVLHPPTPSSKDGSENKMPPVPPVFLTCEDLEESLLAETTHHGKQSTLNEVQQDTEKNSHLMQLLQVGSDDRVCDDASRQNWAAEQDSREVTDGSASLHIMSLLQKKAGDPSMAPLLTGSTKSALAESLASLSGQDHSVEDAGRKESQSNTAEIISLETLFGKGFVNELRSVGEPVSSKPVMDDTGKERSLLDVVFSSRRVNKSSRPTDVGFVEEARWDHHLKDPKESEAVQRSDLQKDFWLDMSTHSHSTTRTSNNHFSSQGLPINGAPLGDFRQPKFSSHLHHQRNFSQGQYHEGQHLPAAEVPSHRMPFEPGRDPPFIHGSAPYGMRMYGANHPFPAFQERFIQASSQVPGYFDERSSVLGNAYRMSPALPSEYPESIPVGYNPNPSIPDQRIGGSRIHPPADRRFIGDQMQASQDMSGFNPYQHQVPSMIQDRKPAYGMSGKGVGAGVKSYNLGLPSETWVRSETRQLPYAASGLDPYMLSGSRPDYG